MRQNWSFLASHISSMFTDEEMKHPKKRTLYLMWNMEEAQLCYGAALLHLAQGVLNLCRVQWNLKTIKAFWSEMCCPVSESLVSVAGHGSSNSIMTQNTAKNTQEWLRTKHWTILKWPSMSPDLNPIEHLWKELKHAVWRRHPSNLRQLEQFAHEEWANIPVNRCRSLIESYRNHLIAVIASKGCATKY